MRLLTLSGSVLLLGLVVHASACSARQPNDDSVSAEANAARFDENNVLSDAELLDARRVTRAAVQRLFERTPWGKRSALADYEVGGKPASQILTEAAASAGINPLELVVRAQMEQRLLSRTREELEAADGDDALDFAFGCGCPHAPVCATSPEKYTGFDKQAACAAKLLAQDMKILAAGSALRSGWRAKTRRTTEDGVAVTPANDATAALYSYTPYVGVKGGGKEANVGGMHLHWELWQTLAGAVGYGAPPASCRDGGCDESDETDDGVRRGDAGVRRDAAVGGDDDIDTGGAGSGGDDETGCRSDAQCGSRTSGRICDSTGRCSDGCRAILPIGNRCPTGLECRLVELLDDEGVCERPSGGARYDGGSTRSGSDQDQDQDQDKDNSGRPPEADPGTPHGASPQPAPPPPPKSKSGKSSSSSSSSPSTEDGGESNAAEEGGCAVATGPARAPTNALLAIAAALGGLAALRQRRNRRMKPPPSR